MIWSIFGQFIYFILQFVGTIIISRLLSPHEVGIFSIALATIGVATAVQSLGLGNYIIGLKEPSPSILASVFSINIIICSMISALIIFLSFISEAMFADAGVRRVLLWLAWTPLISSFALVPTAMLQREGNFKAVSLLKIVSTAAGTIFTVSFAFAGYSYMSLAFGQVITVCINVVLAFIIAPHHTRHRPNLTNWKEAMLFGAQMLSINGVTQIQRQMQSVVLGKLLGLGSLGIFSRAGNLYNILYDNIYAVIAKVLLVDLVGINRSGQSIRERYCTIIACLTALLWPAFAGLAVLSGPFVHLVYGKNWIGAVFPLSILCLNGVLWVAIALTWELFVVANQVAIQARIEFIRAIVGLSFFIAGACVSLSGAAVGLVIEGAFAIVLYRPHIQRITQCQRGDLWPIYLKSGLLTVLAIAPVTGVMAWLGWPLSPSLLLLASMIAAGIVLWALAILLTGHPLGREAKLLLHRRLKKRNHSGS